ncbi:MAG: phytoene desaturase [Geminicoccaceae bacterium]
MYDQMDRPGGSRSPRALVIGSGFGGLAAAVRLGARGYRVTLLEKLDAPGGRAYVFRQDGFSFDAGPTIITAPFLFEDLWRLCGRRLEDDVTLVPMSPFYRVRFEDGSWFDTSGDPEAMRREVERLAPQDLAGYERFLSHSRKVCEVAFEGLSHVPFLHLSDMAKITPELIRLGGFLSVYQLVSRFVKDEKLRTVLSFHPLLIGGNPFRVTSFLCLISHLERHWGVHFALGGTGSLVKGLVGLIEGQGGRLRFNAEVREITLESGRATGVVLKSGERIDADVVVANVDSAWTYRHLLPKAARSRWTDRRLNRSNYSMGLVVWYFGTKRRYDEVLHHTILLGPRYRELLHDIFDRKSLAEDFSLYLHRPTATDPSLAPEGCDAFYVLSPVPNLDGDIDWAERAEPYRQAIADHLGRTVLPDLGDQIVTSRVMTPQDFQDRLCAYKGAGFGLEPTLTQSAWFRPHNRSEDIENLYLVGAGTHPGAGLPGVLSSARILDQVVPDAATLR